MAAIPLVLITGGNGFVGYPVIANALKAGYHVRAAVRRQDAIETISRGPSVQHYIHSQALTFVQVPDNTAPNAYYSAAQDCTHIIHIASPLATLPGDLVSQAVAGNKAILDAASNTLSVKRVVFTASNSSIRPFARLIGRDPAVQTEMLTADTVVPTPPKVSEEASGFERYVASKIAALNYVREYAADSNKASRGLHFSIVNLMPGWIFGPEELSRSKSEAFKGSNQVLSFLFAPMRLNFLFGLEEEAEDCPLLSGTVHVDDVAEAHVKALDTEKVSGEFRNFILCSDSPNGAVWMDAEEIVRKELPREVQEGLVPFAGKLGTIQSYYDAAPAERDLLGRPYQSFAKQLKDTIGWYVHLKDE